MNSTILEKKVKKLSEKIVKYQNQMSILKESLNVAKESLRKEKKNKTKNNDAIKKKSGGRNTVMKGGTRGSRDPVSNPNSPTVSPPRRELPPRPPRPLYPPPPPPSPRPPHPQVAYEDTYTDTDTDEEMEQHEQLHHFLPNTRPQIPTNPNAVPRSLWRRSMAEAIGREAAMFARRIRQGRNARVVPLANPISPTVSPPRRPPPPPPQAEPSPESRTHFRPIQPPIVVQARATALARGRATAAEAAEVARRRLERLRLERRGAP